MKNKYLNIIILLLNLFTAIILCILMYNQGIFIDEHNFSPSDVYGGTVYSYLHWISLLFLFIAIIISFITIMKKRTR